MPRREDGAAEIRRGRRISPDRGSVSDPAGHQGRRKSRIHLQAALLGRGVASCRRQSPHSLPRRPGIIRNHGSVRVRESGQTRRPEASPTQEPSPRHPEESCSGVFPVDDLGVWKDASQFTLALPVRTVAPVPTSADTFRHRPQPLSPDVAAPAVHAPSMPEIDAPFERHARHLNHRRLQQSFNVPCEITPARDRPHERKPPPARRGAARESRRSRSGTRGDEFQQRRRRAMPARPSVPMAARPEPGTGLAVKNPVTKPP